MRRSDIFPSKYLAAEDLEEAGAVVTIRTVEQEKMRDGKVKPVVTFDEAEKSMVFNVTNWGVVEKMHGEDSDDWIGKQITIYPTETPMDGEMVPCIRVRYASKKPNRKPRLGTQPAPAAKAAPAPVAPVVRTGAAAQNDDINDEDTPF